MIALVRRFGFAAAVAAVLAVMAGVILFKSIVPDGGGAAAAGPPGGPDSAVLVEAVAVSEQEFTDGVQALGTAQARESIVVTPKVADVIRAIRFESGDRVRRGQVLVELASVEQQADLAEARAAEIAAADERARFEALFERGFAPRAKLNEVRAAAESARARVEAGQSRIADRIIRAPFNGVMGLRTASPGQLVSPGDPISTLDDISEIKLDFDVPESRIASVARGVEIVARTAAFPDREFRGRVDHVDSRISPETRTLRVRAILPNSDEQLRPGMLMTVTIRANPRTAIAAPEPAIVEQGDGAYLYVVAEADGVLKAERRPVRTGMRAGGLVEILEGVAVGERVIVEGVTRVRPDQAVRLTAPDAAEGAIAPARPT